MLSSLTDQVTCFCSSVKYSAGSTVAVNCQVVPTEVTIWLGLMVMLSGWKPPTDRLTTSLKTSLNA